MSTGVVEAVGQLARFDAQALGKFLDRRQSGLAAASLDRADAGQVNPGGVGQAILGESFPSPDLTDSLAEGLAGTVRVVVDRLGHRGSVAAPGRSDQSVPAVNLLAESALVL